MATSSSARTDTIVDASPAHEAKVVFWHRDLPPLDAELLGVHTVEADSGRVAGFFAARDALWNRCYTELMANATSRLIQEVARLGGNYAHVHDEAITPKHDDAAGETWLHGRFTYMLYRRTNRTGETCSESTR